MTIKTFFQGHFKTPPHQIVQAPGRLELLGNHTDYNEGLVMSLAVDRYIQMAAAPRPDGIIELVSSRFPEKARFYCDQLEKEPSTSWADYIKGVLFQLRKRKAPFGGFNAVIHGSIPPGAGLSSSGALEVAAALLVRQLYPFRLSANGLATPPARNREGKLPPPDREEKKWIAQLCQEAESEFVGVRCGLLDQLSSLFGKAQHVIEIDFQSLSIRHELMPPEVATVVCDSGVKHQLADGAYNQLRSACETAARKLGFSSLRPVSTGLLEKSRAKLTPREYACALHIAGENQRVVFAERALRQGEMEQFGEFLYQSHESSRDYFGNSAPELDLLVELARAHPACLGARLTGGGFGGATINLVRQKEANAFIEQMRNGYREKTGRQTEPFLLRIVDGA
jgi:galactokinase